jgi:hypothetical protein
MAQMVVQVFYNWADPGAGRAGGWSEVYYPIAATYADAQSWYTGFQTKRLPTLSDDVNIVYVRISDNSVKGDAAILAPDASGTYAGKTDFPDLCLLLRWHNPAFFHSNHYLHGLPEDCHAGAHYTPTGPYAAALLAMFAYINITLYFVQKNPAPPPKKILTALDGIDIVRITSRKIGRPFGDFRGRLLIA